MQQLLKARSGRTSVPQVFVNDAFLGGNDEIVGLGAALGGHPAAHDGPRRRSAARPRDAGG